MEFLILIYLVIPLVIIISALLLLLPMIKQDECWYRYEKAWKEWHKRHNYRALSTINDKDDPMPYPEDFGWKPPSVKR